MAKLVFYDDDARRRVLGGARALYDAVKVTMGPKGRNVVIGKGYGGPTVTHDGVKVAKEMELSEDSDEKFGYKIGAELIKQAANKMNDVAGDGTTTVTVLTYHILNEANRLISAGHNPMELRKGVEQAANETLAKLGKMAEQVKDKKGRIAEVATISAGDDQIGKLIADIMERVGSKGIVTVEDGQSMQLEAEIVEGFSTDKGFVSPYMVTDANRMEAVYEKPSILITDKKIGSVQEFLPVLEAMAQAGKKELVIVADDVEGEALGVLVLNKLKGSFHAVAIKAPSFGDRRKEILQDMAILTGAAVISDEQGTTFENFDLSMLGSARKVIVTKDQSTIIEGGGSAKEVKDRLTQIQAQIENASSEFEKEQNEKRAAALEGKVAVIKVGGATETEIEEKKYRVEDAVHSTKAALAEGIVPGGGVTLVDLSKTIKAEGTDSIAAGKQILKNALVQPFRQLMLNAGINADEKLPLVLAANKAGMGFDVNDPSKIVDLKTVGVVDPARVTKEAILNAVSIASTSMTMGALITEEPEKETPEAHGGMGGGMGMM